MSRWFRFYDGALDDPKVQRLEPVLFKAWVNVLCVASKSNGALPPLTDLAFSLRVATDEASAIVDQLCAAGLLDQGDQIKPHNWDRRQFQSDSSKERVDRYRQKRKDSGLPVLSDYSAFRPALVLRDGEQCVYCSVTANLVVDHMEPIQSGGTDDLDNLALACKRCNSGKSGRTPEGANMPVIVSTASAALHRYRDKTRHVTVTVTPPEQNRAETEQSRAAARAKLRSEVRSKVETMLNSPSITMFNRIDAWLEAGADPELDIYPAITAGLAKLGKPPSSLKYFDGFVADNIAARKTPLAPGSARGRAVPAEIDPVERETNQWAGRLMIAKAGGRWQPTWGPHPNDPRNHIPPSVRVALKDLIESLPKSKDAA